MTMTRRVAIVTGGTRGIGRGIAEALASRGHDLLLTYHSNQLQADIAAGELAYTHGCVVSCVPGDLADAATREAIFETYDRVYGSTHHTLSVVVHNAGQYLGVTAGNSANLGPAGHLVLGGDADDPDAVASSMPQKLDAMHYYQRLYGDAFVDLCERGLARMSKDDAGSLVGISSPGCTLQYNPQPGYDDMPGAGKCVMEHAMRLIALRAAAKGVNCNVVIPGVTHTEAWNRLAAVRKAPSGAALVTRMSEALAPLGATTPKDVGEAVAFLCSDAGERITGVSLPVDGGVHLKA